MVLFLLLVDIFYLSFCLTYIKNKSITITDGAVSAVAVQSTILWALLSYGLNLYDLQVVLNVCKCNHDTEEISREKRLKKNSAFI